jgi:hypothetical protein
VKVDNARVDLVGDEWTPLESRGLISLLAVGEGHVTAEGLVLVDVVPRTEVEGTGAGAGHMVAGDDNDVFTGAVGRFLAAL